MSAMCRGIRGSRQAAKRLQCRVGQVTTLVMAGNEEPDRSFRLLIASFTMSCG